MMKLGIDPGLTGALALTTDDDRLVELWDMPVTPKLSGKGNQVNANLLVSIFMQAKALADNAGQDIIVYLEQVNAMPGQGVTSMFGFGRSVGVIEGVAAAMALPVHMVTPQAWKKRAGLMKKPKEAALTLCLSTWPDFTQYFSRKRDVGRADAALIAVYGRPVERRPEIAK